MLRHIYRALRPIGLWLWRWALCRLKPHNLYRVSGARQGTLTMVEGGTCFFQDETGELTTAPWHSVHGSILVFDHYMHTVDEGATFVSYKAKLERTSGSWVLPNSNERFAYRPAHRALVEARRVPSRESPDFFRLFPEGGRVAELGVEKGLYSDVIYSMARPSELHLVDTWDAWPSAEEAEANYRGVCERFGDAINAGIVRVHRGSDLDYLEAMPDGYLDWLYIDTSHGYAHTRAELRLGSRKVKPDGFLCGHDYVDSRISRRYGHGVRRAVDTFLDETEWRWGWLTEDATPSFVLVRS